MFKLTPTIGLALAALTMTATVADAQGVRGARENPHASVKACVQASRNNDCHIVQNSTVNVGAAVQAGRNNSALIEQRGRRNSASGRQVDNPLFR